ncbi:8453_t:CDS:2 [Rhizophagus irregularis]|nr:8453_t:CDS:2 [Rhizophagus irregularis]
MTDEIIIEDEDITHNPLAEKKKKKRSSESGGQKSQGINKKPSFTKQYFEKGYNNIKEEETHICTILDKDDVHQIIDEDESENNSKRLKNTKITDFAQSH